MLVGISSSLSLKSSSVLPAQMNEVATSTRLRKKNYLEVLRKKKHDEEKRQMVKKKRRRRSQSRDFFFLTWCFPFFCF